MARYLRTWTEEQGDRLHRLMAYVDNPLTHRMYAWSDTSVSGDSFALRVFSDGDYAGCAQTQRPTTGAVLFLERKGASITISFLPRRRSCVSKPTSEAEIVAMDTSVRLLAFPLM